MVGLNVIQKSLSNFLRLEFLLYMEVSREGGENRGRSAESHRRDNLLAGCKTILLSFSRVLRTGLDFSGWIFNQHELDKFPFTKLPTML